MSFITKPDFSNNRQVKQFQLSSTQLSGTTVFGVDDVFIPINFTGDTINIDALQNIRTRGIIFPNTIPTFTGATYQLLGRDATTGKVVEVTGISGGTGTSGTTDYVSNVALNNNILSFSGVGSAYSSAVDLTSLGNPTPPEDLVSTQIIELGEIGTTDIEDAFNAHLFTGSEDPIQDQADGYVLVNTTRSSLETQYLFIGSGGTYGISGTSVAIADDFSLIETGNLEYDVWRDTSGVNKAFSYTQPIRHAAEVRANSFVVEDSNDGGFIRNRRFGNLLVQGYTQLILRGANPNNSRITLTSNGAIGAYDNDRFRYNVFAGRDYSSTVVFGGARKTLTGIAIGDTVRMTDATNSVNMDYAALYINPTIVAGTEAHKIFSIYSNTGNVVFNDGNVTFGKYGLNNVTGTPAYNLAVDSAGNVIETALSAGGIDGGDYTTGVTFSNQILEFTRLSGGTYSADTSNLTWQHASSTFGSSSDVTQNLIPGQATSFTTAVVHNGPIMSPEMVTNTMKNKGFAGLDITGNGAGSSVFAIRFKASNPNNGNVEIGDATNDVNLWNPISEGRKNTVALKRSFDSTVGATITSAGDYQLTGVYANNPVNMDVISGDPNTYYAAFESNPVISGTHLASNPQKIFALRGKGRVLLSDYGSGLVTGTSTYNLSVDSSGRMIETPLSSGATVSAPNQELMFGTGAGYTSTPNLIYNDLFKALRIGVDDTTRGELHLFGNSANNGGLIRIYNSANFDTTVDYYTISTGAGFVIEKNSGTNIYAYEESTDTTSIPTDTLNCVNTDVIVGTIRTTNLTFATLPVSPTNGTIATINDASSVTYRAIASGGGSDIALVMYDGTNWIYH